MNNEYWVCMYGEQYINADYVMSTKLVDSIFRASRYNTLLDMKSIICHLLLEKHGIDHKMCKYIKVKVNSVVVEEAEVDNKYRDCSRFNDDIPY